MDERAEVEKGENIEIADIHHPGGVIHGPVKFNLDDSIDESIETVMENHGLPGVPKDFNLYVTDGSGKMALLDRFQTVEHYLYLLQSYLHIELNDHAPTAGNTMGPQDVGVDPRPYAPN